MFFRIPRACLALVSAAWLASCATLPAERGAERLARLTAERLPSTAVLDPASRARAIAEADARLARPLAVDDAVAIALARSPRATETLAELELAYAELVDASRISNPTLELSRKRPEDGGRTERGLSVVQHLGELITLRARSRIARGEFEAGQENAVRALQTLVAETTSDYFTLVGAEQLAGMRTLVAEAARAGATMAQRYHAAGNLPALERDEAEAVAIEAELAADAARVEVATARAALATRLGLRADERFEVDAALALPAEAPPAAELLIERAMRERLDLVAARRRTEALARAAGVTRRLRWLGEIEVGYEVERESDGERLRGPSVALELPLFHRNQAAVARAEAQVDLAQARALALEGEIVHGVRAAQLGLEASFRAVERRRGELLPLRARIVQHRQERVNFMLEGVFELLEARREELEAHEAFLEALAGYWSRRAALTQAIGRETPLGAVTDGTLARVPALPEASEDVHEHHHDGARADPAPSQQQQHEHHHDDDDHDHDRERDHDHPAGGPTP